MSSAQLRSDKPRRAIRPTWREHLLAGLRPSAVTQQTLRSIIGRGLTITVVSGIGLAGLGAFGPATSQAATTPGIIQTASVTGVTANAAPVPAVGAAAVAERAENVSRSVERVPVEQLAEERAEQIAQDSEAIVEEQQQAALSARSTSLSENAEAIETESDRLRNLANFLWPTAGGVGSKYGMRLHPILRYYRMHDGVDIGGACGQPIYAAQSGVVTNAANGYNGGSGNNVTIDHGDINGTQVTTRYMHMMNIKVSSGDRVSKGDLIGTVGNTGLSTACHLHLSLKKNGSSANPLEYVKK